MHLDYGEYLEQDVRFAKVNTLPLTESRAAHYPKKLFFAPHVHCSETTSSYVTPKPSPGQAVHMQATAKLAREPFHRKL